MGNGAAIIEGEIVVTIAAEIARRQQREPCGVGVGITVAEAAFKRCGRREVAGEVAGVEIDAMETAGPGEAHDTPVVAGDALASALPSVHPLAVAVVLA